MPVKNLTTQKLIYSYMPSIDARPSKELRHWYTLLPNEEAQFTEKLQNNFVNFWVGTDYPWEFFHFQCTENLSNLWYGPIEIVHNILIKEVENDVPIVYNNQIKLTPGYGAVTSFENHKKEKTFDIRASDKLEYVLMIFTVAFIFLVFVLMYIRFLL